MSAPVVMKRHKLQPGFVCLPFLVFYLPWRHVCTPDCKAPPERCFIPILLVTKTKFCTTLMCLYRFHLTWNGTQISQLSSVGFDIVLISCCILHTMNSLLMKLLSPLSLPPALHKSHPYSAKDQDIQDTHIFPRVILNWFLLWFRYLMSCSIVSQIVLFFFLQM